jgi:hypothetical protein
MKAARLFASLIACLGLCACVTPTPPYLDASIGESVAFARARQTLNPEASRNTDPAAGIEGTTAVEGMTRYVESFRAPPRTFEVINVNGAAPR